MAEESLAKQKLRAFLQEKRDERSKSRVSSREEVPKPVSIVEGVKPPEPTPSPTPKGNELSSSSPAITRALSSIRTSEPLVVPPLWDISQPKEVSKQTAGGSDSLVLMHAPPKEGSPTPERVIEMVSELITVEVEAFTGPKRSRQYAWPRQTAMYFMWRVLQLSYPQIGKHLGGRDHTTVMHGCYKVGVRLYERHVDTVHLFIELFRQCNMELPSWVTNPDPPAK